MHYIMHKKGSIYEMDKFTRSPKYNRIDFLIDSGFMAFPLIFMFAFSPYFAWLFVLTIILVFVRFILRTDPIGNVSSVPFNELNRVFDSFWTLTNQYEQELNDLIGNKSVLYEEIFNLAKTYQNKDMNHTNVVEYKEKVDKLITKCRELHKQKVDALPTFSTMIDLALDA